MAHGLSDRWNDITSKYEYDMGSTGTWVEYGAAHQLPNKTSYGERIASIHYDGNDEFLWHSVFKQGKEYKDDTPAFLASIDGNSNDIVTYFEFLASSYH